LRGDPIPAPLLAKSESGNAILIEQQINYDLLAESDAIFAVLDKQICKHEVIVQTTYRAYAPPAVETPEGARARIVDMISTERRSRMKRWGGDITMVLNRFHRLQSATTELKMKMKAQVQELDRKAVEYGYAVVFQDGTPMLDALERASLISDRRRIVNPNMRDNELMTTYARQLAFSLDKGVLTMPNLDLMIKKANLYALLNGGIFNRLIVPVMAMDKNCVHADNLIYNITGLKAPVQREVKNVFKHPASDMRIITHRPLPVMSRDGPYVEAQNSGMSELVYWLPSQAELVHRFNLLADTRLRIVDFESGGHKYFSMRDAAGNPSDEWDEDNGSVIIRPDARNLMSSAIVAAADPAYPIGAVCYKFPQTGADASFTAEEAVIQVRIELGATLFRPERVVTLPHIHSEAIIGGYGSAFGGNGVADEDVDLFHTVMDDGAVSEKIREGKPFRTFDDKGTPIRDDARFDGMCQDMTDRMEAEDNGRHPAGMMWCGVVQFCKEGVWRNLTENQGPLGSLDDIRMIDRLRGYGSATPSMYVPGISH
jgi:hypothetical protein